MDISKRNTTNIVGALFAAFGALALQPQQAFAEEGLGMSLVIPKLNEFVPMLIVFLIVWFIFAKYAWPAITGMLDKRAATIKDSLESAEAAKVEAQELLHEYKQQLQEARHESNKILDEARKNGNEIKNQITAEAQEEAKAIVAKAQVEIENEKKRALAELQSSVADVSIAVAGKYIGEELSDDEQRKLIEKYLTKAGKFDAN